MTSSCPLVENINKKSPKYGHDLTPKQLHEGRMANLYGLANLSKALNITLIAMHGTLLGWSFNQKMLPWDEDVDVVFRHDDHAKLHNFSATRPWLGPSTRLRELVGPHNHIEFRVVDDATGVYTDMTSLRKTADPKVLGANTISRPHKMTPPLYAMKASYYNLWGAHLYQPEDIDPAVPCRINNVGLHCPRNAHKVLVQEYPMYKSHSYKHWKYDMHTKCWTGK